MRDEIMNFLLTVPSKYVLAVALIGGLISEVDWTDGLGVPAHPSPFDDMTECQTVEKQTICFDTFEMWYGVDGTPVYYIENGTVSLFWE